MSVDWISIAIQKLLASSLRRMTALMIADKRSSLRIFIIDIKEAKSIELSYTKDLDKRYWSVYNFQDVF